MRKMEKKGEFRNNGIATMKIKMASALIRQIVSIPFTFWCSKTPCCHQ
jgi:hypothetical protein